MSEVSAKSVVSASNLVLTFGTQTVLHDATIAINEGDRVGLLGRNGCGKSSFLRIVAGEAEPDDGMVTRRRDLVTGYLPQGSELDPARSVRDNIREGARAILDCIDLYESAPVGSEESAALLERITHADGWTLEHRIGSLVCNLHAPEEGRIVRELSGGERRRVALCRALIAQPELLILDEPTNHLDTESIEWLEDFLKRYPGTCLFVTHDRYFLDRVATRIIELSGGTFHSHSGSYGDYLANKAAREETEEGQERRRQKLLKRELEWMRRGPKARRTKSNDRIARFHELASESGPEKELDVELLIPPAPRLANRVIELRNVAFSIGGRQLFSGLDFSVAEGDRVGIVGRNGLGKTSLLRVILGQQPPDEGEVEIGARTRINYVDQGRLLLDDARTIYDEVGEGREAVQLGDESVGLRSYLKRFLFTDERINSKIQTLSGGERSRVILAKILKRGGNVLVLDEPTNDLDLNTLRLLEEALVAFRGCVLVVSHDRYFLNRVCNRILAFEGGEAILQSPGNYDYYLEKRAERIPPSAQPQSSGNNAGEAPSPRFSESVRPRKLKWKEERELEGIEERILKAEEVVAEIEAKFASENFYENHGHEWRELEASLNTSKEDVAVLYARWEELEGIRAENEAAK